MKRINPLMIVIISLFTMLLVSASHAQDTVGLRPDAPTYALHGTLRGWRSRLCD